ncbi:MAG: PASTA domain-containing protein [Candidatus Acidiferrum sp.]
MSFVGGLVPGTCDSGGGNTTAGQQSSFGSELVDINDSGAAVGSSLIVTGAGAGSCSKALEGVFVYQNGALTDIGHPPGTFNIAPTSINNQGLIVGTYNVLGKNYHAWLYQEGDFFDLGQLPGYVIAASPYKINTSGAIAGAAQNLEGNSMAFLHSGTGSLLTSDALGTLPGGQNSAAYGLNDQGVVVGAADLATGVFHGFVYQANGIGGFSMEDLGTASVSPFASSSAFAINQQNVIVGQSDVDDPVIPGATHAVMWTGTNQIVDLNNYLPQSVSATQDGCQLGQPNCWELLSAQAINGKGQIVGIGFINSSLHAFLLNTACVNDGGDTDGDGLCDDWEKNGYTDPQTGQFVDLPHMGADPMHKDIFVQADYMVDTNPNICNAGPLCDSFEYSSFAHTHKPNPDAMTMVINAFADAPVENPDGLTGITIHIDCGPDCIMNPLTGETWGQYSKALAIEPEIPVLGTEYCPSPLVDPNPDDCQYDWTAFDDLKSLNFTPTGRTASFHYMIFAHTLGITSGLGPNEYVSGLGKSSPDSSFVVSLGGLGPYQGYVGSKIAQAGNFMHELGHNLGLMHGGLDDINYKPNYLSIMNYSFNQFGLIEDGTAGYLDYSRFGAIPSLDEFALNESVGLNGGPAIANYGTIYSCFPYEIVDGQSVPDVRHPFVINANGPIDWNCDGTIEPGVLPDPYDIDNDLANGKEVIPPDLLNSFNDWSHLVYAGGAIGGLAIVNTSPTLTPSGAERAVPNYPTPYLLQVVSPGAAPVWAGVTFNLVYTITNSGTQPDAYNLKPVSQFTWWNTSAVPAVITLAPGASQQISIPVNVPTSFGCSSLTGVHARFLLRAVSQANPDLSDTGVAELDLEVPPGQVTVPALTGLPQSAVQAALAGDGFALGTLTMQSSATLPAGTVISQAPAACSFASPGSSISVVVSSGTAATLVPNVLGLTQAAAVAAMDAAGLKLGSQPVTVFSSSVPVGDVVSQNPPAGTQVTPGTFFSLTVASATPAFEVTPNLIGEPISTVMGAINAAGLNLGLISQSLSLTAPDGTVIAQVPAAGSPTSPGSYVNVTLSYNYTLQSVPNIVGDTQAAATSAILAAGYGIGSIGEASSNTAPAGTVILQSPLSGSVLSPTTPVSFSISTGPIGPQSFVVPNVYGLTQSAASSAITGAGLSVGTVTPSQQLSMPAGDVFSQTPQPGAYAADGSAVNLQVSSVPGHYTVPDLVTNRTYYSTASADIVAAGLTPGAFTADMSSTVPYGDVISESPAAGMVVAPGSPVNVTYSVGNAFSTISVPSVAGETQAFATNSLDPGASGFYVSVTRVPSTTVPDGFVISQNPPANSQVPISQTINLVISSGGPVTEAVPNVVGSSISAIITTGAFPMGTAEPTLNAAGFAVGSVTYQPSNSVPFGQVISQNPPAGTMAAWDASVSFIFSSGPATSVTVPNIVGETQGLAISALGEASLRWTLTTQSSQTVPAGVVISQNPPPGTVLLGAFPGTVEQYGNVPVAFVVSAGPNAVPTYSLLTQFGDYGGPYSGDGQFFSPASLAIDPNTGTILAADSTGRIQTFDRNGNFKGYFAGTGVGFVSTAVPGTSQLATIYPTGPGGGLFGVGNIPSNGEVTQGYSLGLAVDPVNGNVVALDEADRVLIFNSAGVFQSTFGSPGSGPGQFTFYSLGGVAIDPVTENILVSDWGNNRVQIFSSSGVYLGQFGTQGAGNGQFGYGPVGIAIDPETRNIVVMDRGTLEGTARVEIFNSSGAYLSQFGAPVQAAGATWSTDYCVCEGLAIDRVSHNIIVQGAMNGLPTPLPSIQIFDSKGNYLSQFGGFGTSAAGGLALDPVSHHIVTFGPASDYDGRVQVFGVPVAPTPSSTALTSSLNPAVAGQSVTFTATVSGSGPTGSVQFYYGDTVIGAPVALASGAASFTTSTLPIGTDSITAAYSGDSNNAPGTSNVLNEAISSNPATISVASSMNPATAGQPVTLTATIVGNSPTGTVAFLNGANSLSAAVPLSGGVASFTTSSLPVGADSITAIYSGDAKNATSTSARLSQVIALAASNTALISSGNHVTQGQPVTFSATVIGDSPTGTIHFSDGAISLGTASLTGNVAVITTSALKVGIHPITAVYGGDKFNATSTSTVLEELISLNGTTTIALGSSINPLTIGQSVTFTATVTGNSPTGTIQFLDGGKNLGSPVALAGEVATYSTSGLTLGTHLITATYSGDSLNALTISAVLSEVVSQAVTTTTLTSSVNPAIVGQAVTLTATVKGVHPSGPVFFLDGSTLLATPGLPAPAQGIASVASQPGNGQTTFLTNGNATITVSALSAGPHSITAVYKGDTSNAPSTSIAVNEVIRSGAAPLTVTPPASIAIPATQANGATSGASPALAIFLAGATAASTLPTTPVELAPQAGGIAITGATVFPLGTTTVTFSFRDANGNVGTATSTVTVALGTPRITGSAAGIGTDASGAFYVNVVLTNTGTGNAQNLQIKTLTIRTLSGTGTVTYNTTVSPALPLALGNLGVGGSTTNKIYLNVPSTVTRISITESGPVQDLAGNDYDYSTAEGVVP